VAQDTWNFTVVWPSERHAALAARAAVVLRLAGVDAAGRVNLNGRDVALTDNSHRCAASGQPAPPMLVPRTGPFAYSTSAALPA
jgi:hypothetical protein